MRSTNLAFELDYLYGQQHDKLFNLLTDDYVFKCDNYAVAYNLIRLLDNFHMCEHSNIVDDCWWPYSWVIFITCLPQDIERIYYISKNLPSTIDANIQIYNSDEEEILEGKSDAIHSRAFKKEKRRITAKNSNDQRVNKKLFGIKV